MRLLVTGSTGFIGRNLVDRISGQYTLYTPGHAELDLLNQEAVLAYVQENRIDVIVHGANKPGHRAAVETRDVALHNLMMFTNLYECCRQLPIRRLIMLGSGSEYNMNHYRPRMSEAYFGQHIPRDETGFSKYLCSRLIENDPRMVDLRIFGIFGPYENYEIRFISNAICKAIKGLPITIKQDRRFDYIWIDDAIRIICYFIDNDVPYRAYNITTDETVSLLWLAERVRDLSGAKVPIHVGRPGMGLEYSGDNGRLKALLPSFRFTEHIDSVQMLYDWYNKRSDMIDMSLLMEDK